jgi:dual specificity tyrosine-phosphorylation-regulated kinase 1
MKTGEPLFSGSDQYDQIKKIVQILGMIPDDIIENMRDQQRNQFFERDLENRWTMRVTDAQREPVVPSTNPRESIREILRQSDESNGNYESFVDLIYRMLAYRPQDRISPADIQQHPFIIAGEQTQPR